MHAPSTSLGRIGALRRCRRGATAIEFAVLAPALFLALLEILQGGFYLYCSAAVERATAAGARAIMVGGLTAAASNGDGFRSTVLCPGLMPGLACDHTITSLQIANPQTGGYSPFVKPDLSGLVPVTMDNTQTTYCVGLAGTYQYLQVFYAVPLISPIWRNTVGVTWNNGKVAFVRSAAAFRNEPFSTAIVTPSC